MKECIAMIGVVLVLIMGILIGGVAVQQDELNRLHNDYCYEQ